MVPICHKPVENRNSLRSSINVASKQSLRVESFLALSAFFSGSFNKARFGHDVSPNFAFFCGSKQCPTKCSCTTKGKKLK